MHCTTSPRTLGHQCIGGVKETLTNNYEKRVRSISNGSYLWDRAQKFKEWVGHPGIERTKEHVRQYLGIIEGIHQHA